MKTLVDEIITKNYKDINEKIDLNKIFNKYIKKK